LISVAKFWSIAIVQIGKLSPVTIKTLLLLEDSIFNVWNRANIKLLRALILSSSIKSIPPIWFGLLIFHARNLVLSLDVVLVLWPFQTITSDWNLLGYSRVRNIIFSCNLVNITSFRCRSFRKSFTCISTTCAPIVSISIKVEISRTTRTSGVLFCFI